MKYLIDSCIAVWWFSETNKISKKAKAIISDGSNKIFLSAASIWELAIKSKLGRLSLPHNFLELMEQEKISILNISAHHALTTTDLPSIHQDPFDRMIIAQAKYENLTLITRDKTICKYPITSIKG